MRAGYNVVFVIGKPGTEKGLRLTEMGGQRGMKELAVIGKNRVAHLIEIADALNRLTGKFGLVDVRVVTMAFVRSS